jgi:hypothetical protein
MAKVRGASLRGTTDFIRVTFGADALACVLRELSPETRRVMGDDGLAPLPFGWYDCGALTELNARMDALLGQGDLALARAAGKALAFDDVNRFFKWLLRLTGPKLLFTRAAGVWRNYHDAGRYVVESIGERQAVLRIEDWDSAHPVMCRRIEGWIERALELTLGEHVAPRIHETQHLAREAGLGPHAFCRYVAEWGVLDAPGRPRTD